jgi:hypothetical protein
MFYPGRMRESCCHARHHGVIDRFARAIAFAVLGEFGEEGGAGFGGFEIEADEGAADALAGLAIIEIAEASSPQRK